MNEFTRKIRESKPFGKIDVIVVVALVAVTLLVAVISLTMPSGRAVIITAPNFSGEYPLNEDARIDLDGLVVVIESGEVFVENSTCPDHRCESMGKIGREGQTIVCSPQAIVIKITSGDTLDGAVG